MPSSLVAVHRHPLKGFVAENLAAVDLSVGQGLPLDRHFAFVSGNRENEPQKGGWVQSRTFLMLTVYPELARFNCTLADDDTTLVVTDPDGRHARAQVGQPQSFGDADALIRRHIEGGPFGAPRLVEQVPGYGHWDFSDTAFSIINLATVRAISEAAGRSLVKERFRGNLYVDGLEPWEEFSWTGCRISIGDAALDVLRPIQRCAMTSTEPGTGLRDVDVPAAMAQSFGHMFCGMYCRVASAGTIAEGDAITMQQRGVLAPYEDLPERTAEPALWPRFVQADLQGPSDLVLRSADPSWLLPTAGIGQTVRLLGQRPGDAMHRLSILDATPERYRLSAPELASDQLPDEVLMAGPFGRAS